MKSLFRILAASTLTATLLISAGCSSNGENSEAEGHITRAQTYADQGQFRSALLEVRNAVQKDPGNVTHVVTLAGIYNNIGAGQQASELLEPWLKDYKEQVALPLARAYILQRKHLSARETLAQVSPSDTELRHEHQVLVAQTQRLAGNHQAAISTLEPVLASDQNHSEANQVMAMAMIEAGDPNGALQLLNEWRERNGSNPELLYLTGLAHYRTGNLEQAANTLTDATASVPNADVFLPVRRNIITLLARTQTEQGNVTEAQVYNRILAENSNRETRDRAESAIEAISRGDLDTARTTLEDLLQQNPENEQVAMMLGALSLQEGRQDQAESLLIDNIDAETTPTPFIRAATIAQIDSGKREEALTTLARAIEARPNDVDLLAMHGILALGLPEHAEKGVTSLSKALNLDSSRSRLRLALARHYMEQGQQEQALGQMRVAFTNSPTDWNITQSYLTLLIRTGQTNEAEEVKDSLINGFSDERQALLLASLTEFQLGDADSAKTRLRKQISDHPDWQPAHLALGSVYQGSGETAEAIESLLNAAALNPANLAPLQQAGRLYASSHTPDEVVDWLQATADQHPGLATNSQALAAQVRVQQGQMDDARAIIDAMSDTEENELTLTVKGQLLVAEAEQAARQENWTLARSKAAEAAALQPDNLTFTLIPISITAMEGRYDEALTLLDNIEANRGKDTRMTIMRAQLIQAEKGPEETWKYLEREWEDHQDASLLPMMVGMAPQQSPGDMEELTSAWVDSAPNNLTAHLARANYLMQQGREPAAVEHYEAVIQRRYDTPLALNNLAWLLREDDTGRALELSKRASELVPQNAAILDTHGWILHLAGQHQEAVTVLEQAHELAPDNEEIRQHLETARSKL